MCEHIVITTRPAVIVSAERINNAVIKKNFNFLATSQVIRMNLHNKRKMWICYVQSWKSMLNRKCSLRLLTIMSSYPLEIDEGSMPPSKFSNDGPYPFETTPKRPKEKEKAGQLGSFADSLLPDRRPRLKMLYASVAKGESCVFFFSNLCSRFKQLL